MQFDSPLIEKISRVECKDREPVRSFRFEMPDEFEYSAGQFFIVKIRQGDEKLIHHFSFSTSPTEKNYIEFTTRIRETRYKQALDHLAIGDMVELDGPRGRFVLDESHEKIGMIAAGIGMTPIRSMNKYCFDERKPVNISLLYCVRTEPELLFRDEFTRFTSTSPSIHPIYTLTRPQDSWKGRRGRINSELIREVIPDYFDRFFYICGPPQMVTDMQNSLQTIGIPKEKIRKEVFTGYK